MRVKISLTPEALPAALYDELEKIPTDKGRANRIRALVQTGYMAERLMQGMPSLPAPAPVPAAAGSQQAPRRQSDRGGEHKTEAAGGDGGLHEHELDELFPQ